MAAKKLNLDNFLPYRLSVASNALSSRIAAEYQNRFGLKIPEWRLMAVLGEGKPKTQREDQFKANSGFVRRGRHGLDTGGHERDGAHHDHRLEYAMPIDQA